MLGIQKIQIIDYDMSDTLYVEVITHGGAGWTYAATNGKDKGLLTLTPNFGNAPYSEIVVKKYRREFYIKSFKINTKTLTPAECMV